ncbi:MAG: hypothetical protein ACRCW2_03765 [Cellulosilyticaceae bacterium]
MILAIELGLLIIGLLVFKMQHQIKRRMSIVASKLVYWTTLLFVSLGINSILFVNDPGAYNIANYFNDRTLIVVCGILAGYIILQWIAPSRSIQRVLKSLMSKKKDVETERQLQEEVKDQHQNSYLKELHFETFLETICWLGFVFALSLELMNTILGGFVMEEALLQTFKYSVCMMMMITIPIGVRQIVFYLYRVRGIKEEQEMTEVEMKFHHKLKNHRNRL